MKKYFVMCAAAAVALSFASCKSSESAYKKAYEKAQAAQDAAPQVVEEVVYAPAPIVEKPVVETPVVEAPAPVDVAVRSENVEMIDGANLKTYSVVVGSFGVKANAERRKAEVNGMGYNAQIVKSPATNTYRVVASTSDSKAEAAKSRGKLLSTYNDAWLLMKK